jgi:peptide/nickel transport system permease protein
MGRVSDPEVYQALRRQYGLDQPLVTQYFVWLGNVIRGNLGYSISTGQPVIEQIAERLPRTLYLLIGGVIVTLVLAVPTGILAAAKHNSWIDLGITTLTLILMSIPSFWLAIMLILAPARVSVISCAIW